MSIIIGDGTIFVTLEFLTGFVAIKSQPMINAKLSTKDRRFNIFVPLGARVSDRNPVPQDYDFSLPAVDQSTWQQVDLRFQRNDGAMVEAQLLRPTRWIDDLQLSVGSQFKLTFSDIEVEGDAIVTHISRCSEIADGQGNVVTGRFITRQASNLIEVTLENGATFAGTTNHPVWVPARHHWLSLEELEVGLELDATGGPLAIKKIKRKEKFADVFNIEVHGHHVYRIEHSGILVHNAYQNYAQRSLARNDAALYRALGGARAGHTAHHLVPVSVAQQRGLKGFFQRAAKEGWDINGAGNGLMIDNIIRHVNHHPRYNAYVAQRIQGYINKSDGLKNISGSQARQYLESLSSDMRRFLNNSNGDVNKLFEWIK